jgi:hypothetical protein
LEQEKGASLLRLFAVITSLSLDSPYLCGDPLKADARGDLYTLFLIDFTGFAAIHRGRPLRIGFR